MSIRRIRKPAHSDADIQHFYMPKEKPLNSFFTILKNSGLVFGILTISTLISFAFRSLGIHETNYIMTYILGVLFIANFTKGYFYGIIASVLGVLVFNYFFTEPYYTLLAYSPEYPVTFLIMLIVAVVTSTLTTRVRYESQQADMREKRIRILYQIERHLLAAQDLHQVLDAASKDVFSLFGSSILVTIVDQHMQQITRCTEGVDIFNSEKEKFAYTEALQSGNACGAGTELFSDCRAYYQPICGQSGVLGVIGIAINENNVFSESQRVMLETIAAQVALAFEREQLFEKQQQTQIEIERERLRSDLLRSVSHDLRTPLTGILGSASTMIENYKTLADEVKLDFLHSIYEDAEWLKNLVENILSMTRFSNGNVPLKKDMEVVEELVAGAILRTKARMRNHSITLSIPKDLLLIHVDGLLIEQVLVNLIDNAIKYTPEETAISIFVTPKEEHVLFEVCDNGPGIAQEELTHIFERFYSLKDAKTTSRRGIGLGLTICKDIVEAHGGQITAQNNAGGGAKFAFTLPVKENTDETSDTHR